MKVLHQLEISAILNGWSEVI